MKFNKFQSLQGDIERVLKDRRADAETLGRKRHTSKRPISGAGELGEFELFVYGVIGESFWDAGISALDFNQQLAEFKGEPIVVRINSPGGDVFDGVAMFNALQAHDAHVTTINEGQAMSAASLVLQAGDTRIAEQATTTMIHRAWTMAMGNARDMQDVAAILEQVDGDLADLYAATTSVSADKALELMDQETFMTGQQALDDGFVDQLGREAMASGRRFHAGESLANRLNNAIDGMVSEQATRADIVEEMASAAGIDTSAVNKILNAEIDCPPLDRLEGFASVLQGVSTASLRSAAESDGCNYDPENRAPYARLRARVIMAGA